MHASKECFENDMAELTKNFLVKQSAQVILKSFADGTNIQTIARDLGLQPSRVKRTLILEMLKRGDSFTQISHHFDTTPEGICLIAKKYLNVEEFAHAKDTEKQFRKNTLTVMEDKILSLHKDGTPIHEISKTCNVLSSEIKRLIKSNTEATQRRFTEEQPDRAQEIIALLNSEKTLQEIGNKFGISRERVRQIAKRHNYKVRETRHTINQRKRNSAEQSEAKLVSSITSWVGTHPGCYLSEIASAIKVVDADVKKLCPQIVKRLVLDGRTRKGSDKYKTYTRDQILVALQKAYELRNPSMSMYAINETEPLSGPYYKQLREEGTVHGPSNSRILQIFGTWKAACEEAGVPSIEAVRDVYELRWTDEELISQIAEFISTTDLPSYKRFDEWCRLNDSRASPGTIRNQIGPWLESYELALRQLRRQWTNE